MLGSKDKVLAEKAEELLRKDRGSRCATRSWRRFTSSWPA
jgi:hypothetical protein